MAQQATTYRINRLAKDFNVKSKEILDILKNYGFEGKTHMAILEPGEFNLFMELFTSQNQISNIDEYVRGDAVIPRKTPKKTAHTSDSPEKDSQAAPEKSKDAVLTSDSVIKDTVNDAAKGEIKGEIKGETEKSVSEPAKNISGSENKAEAAPEGRREPSQAASQKAEAEKAEAKRTAEPSKEENAARTETRTEPKAETRSEAGPEARDNRQKQQGQQPRGDQHRTQNQGQGQRQGQQPRQGQGQQNQQPRQNQGQQPRQGQQGQQQNQQPRQNQNQQPRQGQGQQQGQQQGQPKNAQTQQKPTAQGRGQVEAPKKNRGPWQPAENAAQQPKQQKPAAPADVRKKTGATRVVDTRAGTVNLAKYDEHLNSYVSDRDDNIVTKQKLKKQNNRSISSKDRDKERRAIEKLRKEEVEKQRRQQLTIQIPDEITVGELANRLKITSSEVIKKLMMNGIMSSVNEVIDFDTAYIITEELGAKAEREVVITIEDQLFESEEENAGELIERSPVVCVMGHVDHGKTSLLDAIRHTNVTSSEAGGITQHIGAYRVEVGGRYITFLDTPGHEAFTAMRLRGAQATDIAIIVVAADDGIMPQTVEAINHARAAGVEIIVAINKMDKPSANPDNVMQELTKYGLVPEEWGGDIMCVPVSAITKQGIDKLLESVLLIADVEEYKANPDRRAKGLVIEARLDKGRGPVATILVQNGTLHSGDIVIAGTSVGRVRVMSDESGRTLTMAGPSVPVEITGLAEVPAAGDEFNAVEDERMARELAAQRREKAKEEMFRSNARANLNDMFAQIESGIKDFNIIIKADVGGSAEAVKSSLQKLSNEEVRIQIIHAAVGGIIESDVQLAAASNAIIVGFNVRPDKAAIDMADRMGVEIRTYRVIYTCKDEIELAMKGMLAPKYREQLLGHAEVRQTIHVPNVGTIAGCYVQDGKIARNAQIRVVRDGVVIFEDKISSLRHFKEDRREMAQGFECGIGLDRFNDIKERDILECFEMVEIER